MNTNKLLNNTQLINTNRAVDNLTSSLQRNCEINSNKDYNYIKTILEEGCNNTLNTSNPEAVNYLYLSYIRGGSNKKSMNIKENICNTCNKEMKGGCFTCLKSKKAVNSHFKIIVVNLPKLYKIYKMDKSINKLKKKGGYSSNQNSIDTILDENSSYKIDDLLNFKYLNNFSNYKEYSPFNVSDQISLS